MDTTQSQAKIALYYRYGINIEPNLKLATYWYKKATEQSYQLAVEPLIKLA